MVKMGFRGKRGQAWLHLLIRVPLPLREHRILHIALVLALQRNGRDGFASHAVRDIVRRIDDVGDGISGDGINGNGTLVELWRSVLAWVAVCPHPKPSRAVAVLGGVLGLENAAVDVGDTLVAKGRSGDNNAAVTRGVDGVGMIKGADEVHTVRLRVSHGSWLRGTDLGVFVAWA